MSTPFNTPILFIIFNRLDTASQVFEAIKKVKPTYLYIAADGPRMNKSGEVEKCQQVRNFVLNGIDWECNVKTLFHEKNLGCGVGPATAISWFFENEEEGIILEDDCVPSNSFFSFCSCLLNQYRNNEKIFVISGNNFQNRKWGNASYYFSAHGHTWGWATWRRAWIKYSFNLKNIDNKVFKECLYNYFDSKQERNFWIKKFKAIKNKPNDVWDYQWSFTQWLNGGINILPEINLIKNIGFSHEATHTKQFLDGISMLETFEINQIIHPDSISINREADIFTFHKVFNDNVTLMQRITKRIKHLIKNGKIRYN